MLVQEDFNTVTNMADLLAKTFVTATGTLIATGGPDNSQYHDVTVLTNEDIPFVAYSSVGFWVLPTLPVTVSDRVDEEDLLLINDVGTDKSSTHIRLKITAGGSLVVYGRSDKIIGLTDRNVNLVDGVWSHCVLQTHHNAKGTFDLYLNEILTVSGTFIPTKAGISPTALSVTLQGHGIDDLVIETSDTAMPSLPIVGHPAPTVRVTRMGLEVLSTLSASAPEVAADPVITPVGIPSTESFGAVRVTTPPSAVVTKISTTLFGTLAVLLIEATVPAKERLEWNTEVQLSYDGSEVTNKLRTAPRQEFTYRIAEGSQRLAESILTQWGGISERWAVPVWTESQVIGSLAPGATAVTVSTDDYAYFDNSLALVYENDSLWEVVEITTVSPSSVALLFPTVNNYVNSRLLPCRVGEVKGNISKRHTGYSAITSVTYRVIDNTAIAETVPQQYAGEDLYFEDGLLPDTGQPFKQAVITKSVEADFDVGLFDKASPWLYNKLSIDTRTVLQGAAAIRDFKSFLERRSGQHRAFWQPTFTSDLKLTASGAVTTTLTVEAIGQNSWKAKREHLAILDTSGVWRVRNVTDFTQTTASNMDLTLSVSLGIDASEVALICYLVRSRLSKDLVTLDWVGNNSIVVKATITEVSI